MEVPQRPISSVRYRPHSDGHRLNNIESKENESKENGGNSEEEIDEGKRR